MTSMFFQWESPNFQNAYLYFTPEFNTVRPLII